MIFPQGKKGEASSYECIDLQITTHYRILVLVLSILKSCVQFINQQLPSDQPVASLWPLLPLLHWNPWEAEGTCQATQARLL